MKRPCTVKESIEQSLKEVKEYREGKRNLKPLEKSKQLWNTYIEADTEKVKQAIDKCTKKYEKLLRKLGSE